MELIYFNWSGHGLVDMTAYEAYMSGQLSDYDLPEEEMHRAVGEIAPLPRPKQYKPGTIS